ncbi:MAG: hypothetical protein IKX36_06485 [Prevotella sp.]|nr:hypothetical protein [Prevotella sp.]
MNKQTIDISTWERREWFEHFSRMKSPHYAVAVNADVTRLVEYKRQHHLSFYFALIYLSTKVLNNIENFRLRICDGEVVLYDMIHTNFTHKLPEEQLFRYHTAPFTGTLEEYVIATSKAIKEQTTLFGGMGAIPNVAYFSCAPTLDTTCITNPGLDDVDDAIPRINWGKYMERDGRQILNITFTANHRFIDGYHIGLFFEALQKEIDALDCEPK